MVDVRECQGIWYECHGEGEGWARHPVLQRLLKDFRFEVGEGTKSSIVKHDRRAQSFQATFFDFKVWRKLLIQFSQNNVHVQGLETMFLFLVMIVVSGNNGSNALDAQIESIPGGSLSFLPSEMMKFKK